MTGVSHATLGAAIGKFIPNPFVAFFAGLLSHILVDKVPHFWPKTEKNKNLLIVIDAVVTLSFVLLLFLLPIHNKTSIIAGAFGGVLIDIVFVVLAPMYKPLLDSKLRVWHGDRQTHFTNPWYFSVDVAMIMLSLSVLFL